MQLIRTYTDDPLPATVDRTLMIPGRQGMVDFGADLGARKFVLVCEAIGGTNPTTLTAILRAVSDVLLDSDGRPVDCSLVFTKEPARTYTVRYSGRLPLQRHGAGAGLLSIPLTAADPYAYGSTVTTSATVTADGQEIAVTNSGGYATPPRIRIRNDGAGDITGFTLTFSALKT
jgi:phage-related protein